MRDDSGAVRIVHRRVLVTGMQGDVERGHATLGMTVAASFRCGDAKKNRRRRLPEEGGTGKTMCGDKNKNSDTTKENDAMERLAKAAAALGLAPIPCPSCAESGPPCANCGGRGRLWHSASGLTLADTGLQRLLAGQP